VKEAKSKQSSEDAAALKAAKETLEKKLHKLSEHVYKQAQQQQAPNPSAAASGDKSSSTKAENGDDVVDAEFEEGEKK
jgi:hypothetical protein